MSSWTSVTSSRSSTIRCVLVFYLLIIPDNVTPLVSERALSSSCDIRMFFSILIVIFSRVCLKAIRGPDLTNWISYCTVLGFNAEARHLLTFGRLMTGVKRFTRVRHHLFLIHRGPSAERYDFGFRARLRSPLAKPRWQRRHLEAVTKLVDQRVASRHCPFA